MFMEKNKTFVRWKMFEFTVIGNNINNYKASHCLYKNFEILHNERACKGVG